MFFGKHSNLSLLLMCLGFLAASTTSYGQSDNRVPFRHRVGYPAPDNNIFRIKGDFTVIGNTNLTLSTYQANVQNALEEMSFVDIDTDPETFNSSAATLMFSEENGADPNCTEILYAGLYWSGRTQYDKGLSFELTKTAGLDDPVTLDKAEVEIRHLEEIDYLPYTVNILPVFDNYGIVFPFYELLSDDGMESIIFHFNNFGEVFYNINNEGFFSVENLEIDTSAEFSTATFKPITFSYEGLSYSIGELTKPTISTYDEFIEKDKYLKLVTSGTYRPYVLVTNQFDKRRVKLKLPGEDEYIEISSAGNAILYPHGELRDMYVGYADVTELVKSHGSGEYTVADIALTDGLSDNTGFYGHWGLMVVYQNAKMDLRDVTIFDGYTFMEAQNGQETLGEIEIEGFGAVKDGPVNIKLGLMAGEGDVSTSGDFLEILDQKGNWSRLSHPKNTVENFFNSSIYTPVKMKDGSLQDNPRNPFLQNNTGIDILQWDIPNPDNSIITNNQTSARFRFGTNQDLYTLYAVAFSVLSYSPEIQAHNYIKTINEEAPTEESTVKPGEELTYQIDIRNLGTESSEETRIVIPVPYTAIFVKASIIPSDYGTVTFDPTIGLSGAIIWEIGDVPIMENSEDIIASLEYTLKLTEDCFVLANDNCDALVSVNGSISGIGSLTQQLYADIPFIRGFMEDECSGNAIYGPLETPISGKAEFAAAHCGGYELFTGLEPINLPVFCQGDTPGDLSKIIPPSKEGYQVYFFTDEIGGIPLQDYYVNTSILDSETIWVSEGPIGACTGMRIPIELVVKPRAPQPYTQDREYCMDMSSEEFIVDPEPGYTVLYYPDNDPLTNELTNPPQLKLSTPGTYSVWVSQFKAGECESFRKEVKYKVEDCSLRPDIQVTINSDMSSFSGVGEEIFFTLVVKNTGGVALQDIWIYESLLSGNITVEALEIGEEKSFIIPYTTTSWDLAYGVVYLAAETYATDSNYGSVYDSDQIQVPVMVYPVGFLDYTVSSFAAICEVGGAVSGLIKVSFGQLKQTGTYIALDLYNGIEYTGEFINVSQFQINLPSGEYELRIGDDSGQMHAMEGVFIVEPTADVDFNVPSQVVACGEYLFGPESDQSLVFEVLSPSGSKIYSNSNDLFLLKEPGIYQVIGRDPSGELCTVVKSFEADITLPAALEVELLPYCSEDAFATVSLLSAIDSHQVQWYSVSSQGVTHLAEYDGSAVIMVFEDGEYRVTLTDVAGCVVGIAELQVTQSFTDPPLLSSLYSICAKKNINVAIEPGSRFQKLSWMLNGAEVSVSPIFIPTQEGEYSLIATDYQGCTFFTDFEVENKCEPELSYPTAIWPNDAEKHFVIYPDNLIDELELFIYNRWGQLIYNCADNDLQDGIKSSCVWDGTFNKSIVPTGSYSVLLNLKVMGQSDKIQKTSITVFN